MKEALVGFAWDPHTGEQIRQLLAAAQAAGCRYDECKIWLFGSGAGNAIGDIPCAQVVCYDGFDEAGTPELILPVLESLYRDSMPDIILVIDTFLGGELASRLAYRTGLPCRRGIIKIAELARIESGEGFLVSAGIYGQNLTADYAIPQKKAVFAIARNVFEPVQDCGAPEVKKIGPVESAGDFLKDLKIEKTREQSKLEDARLLVIAGKGAGSKAAVQEIAAFADLIGAEYGVSRPVAADGWAGYDRVIGMSGVSARAEKTLIFGVSGAAAFRAGIRGSRFTIAVNHDPDASIFKVSDAGLVGDYKPVLDRLADRIKNRR